MQVSEAQEPQIANCISFNGTITTNLVQLEENKFGFILRGPNNEEFPLIILNTSKEDLGNSLLKDDKISAYGRLIKYNNDWAIEIFQVFRQPTEEEIKKLT
jgi:hypothetical protein